MFYELFHIANRGDCLQLSIRSSENRADAYLLSRSDIEPSLDDDPTDNEWSGSDRFSMKRTPKHGFIRISENGRWIIFKVSRHQIEVLNARLKAAVLELPTMSNQPTITRVEQSQTAAPNIDYNELLSEIRTTIREELRKINFPSTQPAQTPSVSSIPTPTPSSTFIPSNLGEGLAGQVQASTKKSDGQSALEAAKKLKELKK